MSIELACFYGIIAIAFLFLQRVFLKKAKHILIKTLPISLSTLSFLLCLSIYLIKLYLIKSKNHYIQMSVDEIEVMFVFYLTIILSSIIGCLLGIISTKLFKNKKWKNGCKKLFLSFISLNTVYQVPSRVRLSPNCQRVKSSYTGIDGVQSTPISTECCISSRRSLAYHQFRRNCISSLRSNA